MPRSSSYSPGADLAAARSSVPIASPHVFQEAFIQSDASLTESVIDWYVPDKHPADGTERRELRAIRKAIREERKRIARDIHDYAEQLIAAVMLRLSRLEQNPADAKSHCNELRRTLAELDESLRRITNGLRVASICNGALPITLSRIAERWTTDTGIPISVSLCPIEFRDPNGKISTIAARVAQLMLNNVAKHAANATVVNLRLERLGTALAVTVEDNGPGFCAASQTSRKSERVRSGHVSMQEHLAEIGGHLVIDSTIGTGTKVVAVIPVSGCS